MKGGGPAFGGMQCWWGRPDEATRPQGAAHRNWSLQTLEPEAKWGCALPLYLHPIGRAAISFSLRFDGGAGCVFTYLALNRGCLVTDKYGILVSTSVKWILMPQ